MSFREYVFVKALTERVENARMMSRVFQPSWLETAPLQPVLQAIYQFVADKGVPPNISTLREMMRRRDEQFYANRMKAVLDQLEATEVEIPDALHELDLARDVAISRSLGELVQSEGFRAMQAEHQGTDIIDSLNVWMRSFMGQQEGVEMNLREAIDYLVAERAWNANENIWIKSGLGFLDEWCGGGLQKKEFGILIGPTGHGKSVLLTVIAHNIAKQLERNVLYLSNELTMKEIAERYLSRITGERLDWVRQDPAVAYKGLDRHWVAGMHDHLRLVENLGTWSTDYIESVIAKYINLYGWKPDVIVVDYMERMKPTVEGLNREKTWIWLKEIGQDLVRLAKKGDYLVWTACQTNRTGYNTHSELSLEQAQGSIQHLQQADFITMFRKVPHPNHAVAKMDMLQFACRKARSARADQPMLYVEADLKRMWISENVTTELIKPVGNDAFEEKAAGGGGDSETPRRARGRRKKEEDSDEDPPF